MESPKSLDAWKQLVDGFAVDYYIPPSMALNSHTDARIVPLVFRYRSLTIEPPLSNTFTRLSPCAIPSSMQPAVLSRFVVINPPIQAYNDKALPGSQLTDMIVQLKSRL